MVNLTELPDLVLERIVHFVIRQSDRHDARRSCAVLCTVSRSLNAVAARELYRDVNLEYGPGLESCEAFSQTVRRAPDLANYVRQLDLSSSAGWCTNYADSRRWAGIMQSILKACLRLEEVRYTPDEDAKNHEEAYLAAWTSSPSLNSFTLVFRQFRELVLLPSRTLENLTLELQQGGDMNWDYDILLRSWPTRCTKITALRIANLSLYAYAEELHLGMLAQVFRAISPPKKLHLVDCCFSVQILDAFLRWASPKLEELSFDLQEVVDETDRAAEAYTLPELPYLRNLKLHRTDVRMTRC